MAKREEMMGQRTAARTLLPEGRLPLPQTSRPRTPFSVPLPQRRKQWPSRPATPFRVPEWDDDTPPEGAKYLTSTEDPWDFPSPRVIRMTRRKFRCQKPYEDKTLKVPNTGTAERLQGLRVLTKILSSKKTLNPMEELEEIRKGKFPLPPEAPERRSNPLSKEPRPSALRPDSRKRAASTFVPVPGKVQRSLDMSTVFEQPIDFDQSGTRVPATSSRHCAGDASEKFNADDTVPAPSSADQHGLVISPHIRGPLQPSPPAQGVLGSSTSSQDAQGLSLSTQEVLGEAQCDPGAMGHSTSAQPSQRSPTFAERKIKHVSFSRRGFRNPSSGLGDTDPPKSFRQAPSDQGGLPQAPSEKEGSKPSSPKVGLSDSSFSQNGLSPTTSPQRSLTLLTAAEGGWSTTFSHEDRQVCTPSPPKGPKQCTSAEVSLSPASSEQGKTITSPLNQEGFTSPPSSTNGLSSSLTAQRGLSLTPIPQVSFTPLISAQAETKISTPIPEAGGPLPSLEGAPESSMYPQEVLGNPEPAQGTPGPSQHTQSTLAPSPSSPWALSSSIPVEGIPGLSTPRAEGQRPTLSHKGRFKPNPAIKRDPGPSHCSKRRWRGPSSKQGDFTVSLSGQEGFNYSLPAKKALLTRHRGPNRHTYSKTLSVSHVSSTSAQGAEKIKPSLHPQRSRGLSTYVVGIPEHSASVQHSLESTLSNKTTMEQSTSTQGIVAISLSLEMALECDTSRKDIPGHSPSDHRVLDPALGDLGAMGCDTCTQESVVRFTSRKGDSCTAPLCISQQAVGNSPALQEYHQSVITTQEATEHFPSAQRAVSPSTCPQVSPEHPRNTPKALDSALSTKGALDPVLSVQLALEPDFIQKPASPSLPEPSVPGTSTYTQGALVNSLPAPEALRSPIVTPDALGETTPTEEVVVPSPHSEATVKKYTSALDTLEASPSEKETPRSTTSDQETLPSSPSSQEGFMRIPYQGEKIRPFPSVQVDPGQPISTKKRLRYDPSDQGEFRLSLSEEDIFNLPSAKRGRVVFPAPPKSSITTSTPQVSPTASISVQKEQECSMSNQKTMRPCQSIQRSLEHSGSSQVPWGPTLSVPKVQHHSLSDPGLKRYSLSLSKTQENSPHAQGTLSLSKTELGAMKPSQSAQGSEGKYKSIQRTLGIVPLAQEDLTSSLSSKTSKDSSVFFVLTVECLPSPPGSPISSTSKQDYLGTSRSVQEPRGHSPSAPGTMSPFQSSQVAIELLTSVQRTQESFATSLSYSRHLTNLRGDLELSSLEGPLGHVLPGQGVLETSLWSPRVKRLMVSLQSPLDLSMPSQGAASILASTQGAKGPLLSFPNKVGPLLSVPNGLQCTPSDPGFQRYSLSLSKTPENSPHVQGASLLYKTYLGAMEPSLSTQASEGKSTSIQRTLGFVSLAQKDLTFPMSPKASKDPSTFLILTANCLPSRPGSPVPSTSKQDCLGTSWSVQVPWGYSPSAPGTMSSFQSSQVAIELLTSVQGTQESFVSSFNYSQHITHLQEDLGLSSFEEGTLEHVPPGQGVLETSLWSPRFKRHMVSLQSPLDLSMPSHGAAGYSKSTQGAPAPLLNFPNKVGTSQSAQRLLGVLQPPQAALEFHPSAFVALGPLPETPEPLSLSSLSQESPSHLPQVHQNLEISQCGSGALNLIPSAQWHQGSPSSSKESIASVDSDQGPMGHSLSAQESIEISKSTQGTLVHSWSGRGDMSPFLSSKVTLEQMSSVEVETYSHAPGSLGHLKNASGSPGPTLSNHDPVATFLPAQGTLRHLPSAQGNVVHALSALRAPKWSTLKHEIIKPLEPAQVALIRLPSSQGATGNCQCAQDEVEHSPPSVGSLKHSSTHNVTYGCLTSAQGTPGILPSNSDTMSNSLSVTGGLEFSPPAPRACGQMLSEKGPKKLSIHEQRSLGNSLSTQETQEHPVPSVWNLKPSQSDKEALRNLRHSQIVLEYAPSVSGSLGTLPSALANMPLSSLAIESPEHSQNAKAGVESSHSATGYLGPMAFIQKSLENSFSGQRVIEILPSSDGEVEHFLSTQGAVELSISTKEGVENISFPERPENPPTSLQGVPRSSPLIPDSHQHSLCAAEALESSSFGQGFQGTLLSAREGVQDMAFVQDAQEISPSISQAPLISTPGLLQICTHTKQTLCPLPPTLREVEHSTSSRGFLRGVQPVQNVLGHMSTKGEAEESSLSALGSTDISLFALGPSELSLLQNVSQAPSPCPQEVVGSFLSECGSLEPSLYVQGSLGLLATALEAGKPSLSGDDTVHLSASASGIEGHLPSTLGPSASKHYNQMKEGLLPSVHGDLGPSLSDQRTLGMTKSAEGQVENLPSSQGATEHPTCSQEAKKSLSGQGYLPHSPCLTEALGPSLSDQGAKEFLLCPLGDIEHPTSTPGDQVQKTALSTPGPQDSLLTPREHQKFSISVCDTLCPLSSTLDAVEHSTSSPECLAPYQSASKELECFSTIEQAVECSLTASRTTKSLSSIQECEGHSSSDASAHETSLSDPGDLAHLLSSQGPHKTAILTQGMLATSASAQESSEPSKTPQLVGTHQFFQNFQHIHECFLPEIEPMDSFASVSETTVSLPFASQPLQHSSLLPVSSENSLYGQGLVASILPSQRALEMLPSTRGTLETLASAQGDGRNYLLENRSVGQSISAQGIFGSSPSTTGHLASTPYAHRETWILPSIQEATNDSLSPQGAFGLSISENGTLVNLPSDQGPSKHSESRQSLFIQNPWEHSPLAVEALRSSCSQGIKKPLLSSTEAVKASSSASDAQKPLQTTLGILPTLLSNQESQECSISVQSTLGSFFSRSGSPVHRASSLLVLGPSASFQSEQGQLSFKVESWDASSSVQRTTGALPLPPRATGHSQHEEGFQGSSLSISGDLEHVQSNRLCLYAEETLGPSPCTQQSLQHSASSPEILGPANSAKCTHKNFSSVSHTLGMSPFVPVITEALPHIPVTHELCTVIEASPDPTPCLQKHDGLCLYEQVTLELNTTKPGSLEPSPSTQVPEQASLYKKSTLGQSTSVQDIEGHTASTSGTLGSNQNSDHKELGVCPPAQVPLLTSLSSQGILGTCPSSQGTLGPSLSSQGSLKPSPATQGMVGTVPSAQSALKHLTSSQEAPRFFPSAQHTLQRPFPSPGVTAYVLSNQKTQESFLSSPDYVEHLPSVPGPQEHPFSVPGTLESLLSSKGPKELSTAAEETTPVQSSLSSIERAPASSVNSSGIWEQYRYSQSTLGHLPHVGEGIESYQSAPGTMRQFTLPLVPGGHSTSTQGASGSFFSSQEDVASLKSAQEPMKLSISAQTVLKTPLSGEGALQSSAPSSADLEPYTNSPFTQVVAETSSSATEHMGLSASPQVIPSFSHSDEGVIRLWQSAQGMLTMSKSAQGTLGFLPSPQHTGGHFLSAEGTLGLSTSAQQTVETMPSTERTLGSTQNTQVILEPLPSDQRPLTLTLSEGTLRNYQAAECPVHASVHPIVSSGLSVSPQVTLATLLSDQGSRKHPASSQIHQRTSQSPQNSRQHKTSVPGFQNPSQSEQNTSGTLSSTIGTGTHVPSSTGSQKIFPVPASSGHPEILPYVGEPLELSLFAQGTLCSFSSPLGDLDPFDSFSANLESSKPTQRDLGHLPYVREPVGNAPSVQGLKKPSKLIEVPRELSSHALSDPVHFLSPYCSPQLTISAECSLRPSPSSKRSPEYLSSSTAILKTLQSTQRCQEQLSHGGENFEISTLPVGTSVYLPCAPDHLGLSCLEQCNKATSLYSQGALGSCLSMQGSIRQPTSTQRTLAHPLSSQGLSSTSSHMQSTGSQTTPAQNLVSHSRFTPVSQGYTHHAQKMTGALKYAGGSPGISLNAQGSFEPLTSPWETTVYSSSAPDACKTSTAPPGHVASDKRILELSLSSQASVSGFLSSQRHLKTSLSVEGTSDLSTPTNSPLESSISCQEPPESLKLAQRVQQTNPSVSDSSQSLTSSKGSMVTSLPGEETLGTDSSSIRPLVISLSVQVSSELLLSSSEARGPCLPSQGTLEVSTCKCGTLGTSISSRGDLGASSSTPLTLVSSASAQVDLAVSLPVSQSLRSPSAHDVLGTLTSTQGAMEFSPARQGNTESLSYFQGDLGHGSPSLGTQGTSQFAQGELKVLSSVQEDFKTALSTAVPVENFLSASGAPRLFTSVLKDAESTSLSYKNTFGLPTSSKKYLEYLTTPKISLEHSPFFQVPLKPTLSGPGTHSLQEKVWQNVSAPSKVTLRQFPPQELYEGKSSYTQGAVGLLTSGQESLGHLPFTQEYRETSTFSHKVVGPSDYQETVAQFPSVPGDGLSPSAQGMLGTLPSSQVSLEISSSLQRTIEASLDMQGVVQLQSYSPGYLEPSQCSPKASEKLSSPQVVFKFSETSSGILGILPSLPVTLRHSISAQAAVCPCDSDQKVQESTSLQKTLQFSPSYKGLLGPTSYVPGTLKYLLSSQLCPELSTSSQGSQGHLPLLQGCLGDSKSMQVTLETTISVQKYLGHSIPDQGPQVTSTSSQENHGTSLAQGPQVTSTSSQENHGTSLAQGPQVTSTSSQENHGTSLAQKPLAQSSSAPEDGTLSQFAKDTLGTSPSPPGVTETSSFAQESIESEISAQRVLEIQGPWKSNLDPSKFTLVTPGTLPTSQEVNGTLKSLSRSLETLLSFLEGLRLSKSAQGTVGTSIYDQVLLRTPTLSQETLECSLSDQGTVKSTPSQTRPVRPSPTEQGLQEVSSGENVTLKESLPQQLYFGNALSTQGALGLSISSQEPLGISPSAQGSLKTSLSYQKSPGPCLYLGLLEKSSSDPGSLGLSESNQGTLRTSPSIQSTLEIPSYTHGIIETSSSVQDSLGHLPSSEQTLQPSLLMKETSKTCPFSKESCNASDTSLGILETLPSILGSLVLSTSSQHSLSEKENLRPSMSPEETAEPAPFNQGSRRTTPSASGTVVPCPSEQGCQKTSSSIQGGLQFHKICVGNSLHSQKVLGLSRSSQEPLRHSPSVQAFVQESPDASMSYQEDPCHCLDPLRPTSSAPGTLVSSPSQQGFQKLSSSVQGDSQSQQGSVGNSLHSQEVLGLSISSQEPLGNSTSVQESSNTSISSQEDPDHCLDQGPVRQSSPDLGDLELSKSSQGTLGTSPCTQSTLETPGSTHGIIETSPPSQDDLGFPHPTVQPLQPCLLTPEKSQTLPINKDFYKPSESVSGSLESFATLPGTLEILESEQDSLGTLVSDQGNLGQSTSPHDTLEHIKTTQGPLKPVPSTQENVQPSFSAEFPGDLIPLPSHKGYARHSPYPKIKPRLSSSTKSVSICIPFPKGDITYSLSELDGLRGIPSAKHRHASSKNPQKNSSPTSTPQRSVPPPTSSDFSCISSSPPKEDLRSSLSRQGRSRHSKSRQTSKESGLKSVPSEDESLKLSHSSKKGGNNSISDKGSVRLKTEPKESLIIFPYAKQGFRSSRSHEKQLRSSPSPPGITTHSKSIKSKLEQALSNKADVHTSQSEHEDCKHSSSSKKVHRHSTKKGHRHSSAKSDQKSKDTPEEDIETSISIEWNRGTTPSYKENCRHSTSPHGTSSHTTSTTTRTRLRHGPFTQEATQTSPEAQKSFTLSQDGYSSNGRVKPSSSSHSDNVRHPVSSKKGFRCDITVEDKQKSSTSVRAGLRALLSIQQRPIHSLVPKGNATSFPVVQGKFRHTLSPLGDLRSSLSYQGRDTSFYYEYGAPICDPSILGGHRYSRSVPCNLKRTALQKGCWNSNLSHQGYIKTSQCNQRDIKFTYGYTVQDSLRMFQSEKESLIHSPSNPLSLRYAPCGQREIRNVLSKQDLARNATFVLKKPPK